MHHESVLGGVDDDIWNPSNVWFVSLVYVAGCDENVSWIKHKSMKVFTVIIQRSIVYVKAGDVQEIDGLTPSGYGSCRAPQGKGRWGVVFVSQYYARTHVGFSPK